MNNLYITFSKLFVFCVYGLLIIRMFACGRAYIPPNMTVSAIIVFGDSIVDTGNNNYVTTIIKSNFPPYGRDFMGGVATGRFCNGRVPSDMIAKAVGLKSLMPAYLDPNLTPEDLLTGVNFTSGGSGYDPLTPKMFSALTLDDQLRLFKEYIAKMNSLVGEEKTKSILADSIYIIVAGSNDIANTYFVARVRQLHYNISSYTSLMIDYGTSFIKQIYALGARRIGVFSAPPLGCLPSQMTLAGGSERNCAPQYNEAAKMYNSKLESNLGYLNKVLSDTRILYIDIYTPLSDVIQNYQKYGFEVATKGCCGSGLIEVTVLCNQYAPHTCPDASKYVFWDSYHPTERAYEILVNKVLPVILRKFK